MRTGEGWADKAECCHVTGTKSEVRRGDGILTGNSVPKHTRLAIYLLKIPDSGIEAQTLHQLALLCFTFQGQIKDHLPITSSGEIISIIFSPPPNHHKTCH